MDLDREVESLQVRLKIYKESLETKIKHLKNLRVDQQERKNCLKKLIDNEKLENLLQCKYVSLQQQINYMRPNLPSRIFDHQFESDYEEELLESDESDEEDQGLTPATIQQFEQFTADESHVGDQCVICMGDIELDKNMMRLDCDGKHTFCQVCIEGWFADHNTCPVCRHAFA